MITIQREPGVSPFEVVDEADLIRTDILEHDDDEYRKTVVEYRYPGSDVAVHRSVHVEKKKGLVIGVEQGSFS